MPIINSLISAGKNPTGTKQITTNGIHDVTDYASADVNVPTTAPAYYVEKTVDANGALQNGSSIIDMTGVTNIKSYVLYNAYRGNTNISGAVVLSDLKKISGMSAMEAAFFGCTGITSVDMRSLEVGGTTSSYNSMTSAFNGCSNLTSFNLESLVFSDASQSSLFRYCTSLTTGRFDSLKVLGGGGLTGCFRDCTNMSSVYFPALKNVITITNTFNNMLGNINGCTLHFPSNLDPQTGSTIISSLPQYPNFGGTNTVLVFDLPATNILTGTDTIVYERNPKYDTMTALAWRVQDTGTVPLWVIDWTPYYTSGTTDPQVNDTIYSDSACTNVVTTIDSII